MDENILIQVNSDHNINVDERLTAHVENILKDTLKHFSNRVTRVEVHLSDENSHKSGQDDKRCALEVRLKGYQPIAVTHQANTIDRAVSEAAEKMKRSIENVLGKN